MAVELRTARHYVRDEIQRQILSGQRRAGDRLSQQALARELGVGQGTVRESLLELQWLGFVRSVDRLGVFVEQLDLARIREVFLVREVLEGLASRMACNHAARADILELRAMAAEISRLAKQKNMQEAGVTDREFHFRIIDLSRNKILERLVDTCRISTLALQPWRDPEVVQCEHLQIVSSIEHNSPDEAEKSARLHILQVRASLEQKAEQSNFIPEWV